MTVLVTGGAGYIGSHMVRTLLRAGRSVVVLDNLSTGHRNAVHLDAAFVHGDVRDASAVEHVLRTHGVVEVLHFAAFIEVGESVAFPLKYWDNNLNGALSLLRAMDAADVKQIVFSSTCAVYGQPTQTPVSEGCPRRPLNPYGWTKFATELALADVCNADPGFAALALRYFNVAGASEDGQIGEDHLHETHLIPLVLAAARDGGPPITIFGTDYPTSDGTCIRDYVHVEDLCDAHLVALERLRPGFDGLNLGIGRGFSVREVIETARRITGRPIAAVNGPRRAGDPPELYADARRAQAALGWAPQYTDLGDIIETAWRWIRQV
jgi:UDP-glucose 4-epimerase